MIVLFPPMTNVIVPCIKDKAQLSLQSHYEYFQANPMVKKQLLIGFGVLTDFLLLFFMARWVCYGGTWRFIIAIFLTYLLRFLNTALFRMRSPENGDLWEFPGFYSLTVSYGRQNDYYYNPVVALCMILKCEYKEQGLMLLSYLSFVALIGCTYLALCLRGNYFIDVYGGIVMGYYIWLCCNNWLSYYVDVKLFGMTMHERFCKI
jgi:hypothetical protein